MDRTCKNVGKRVYSKRTSASFRFRRHFFFVSRADAGENTREIETWDCSKNKKIRAKLRLENTVFMEAPPDGLLTSFKIFGNLWRSLFQAFRFPSFFPSFSPRRIYLAPHLPWTPGTGHLRRVWRFLFSKTKQRKAKKGKKLTQLVYKPVPPCMAHTLVELELRCRRFWSNWLAHIPCFPPKEVCKPKYEGL